MYSGEKYNERCIDNIFVFIWMEDLLPINNFFARHQYPKNPKNS